MHLYFGRYYLSFSAGIRIADSRLVSYALPLVDLNNHKKVDILVGHVEAPSSVFFNDGTGRQLRPISFGDAKVPCMVLELVILTKTDNWTLLLPAQTLLICYTLAVLNPKKVVKEVVCTFYLEGSFLGFEPSNKVI